jgi:hypothetical protein
MGHAKAALWAAVAASTVLTAAFAGWTLSAPREPEAGPSPMPPSSVSSAPSSAFATSPASAPTTFVPPPPIAQAPAPQVPAMAFGGDVGSVAEQARLGAPLDYATIWIGAWNLQLGWNDPDRQLRALREGNVTPAIHFYYWGDDLSPRCLEEGCAGKSQAGWDQLATELVQHLKATLEGRPTLVFLETEFNKGSVARYKPLDALLADKAAQLHEVPGVHVVLALGNWNPADWPTWSRAAAASDFTGLQAMFGATRDPVVAQKTIVNRTVGGARQLQADFGKPVILHDLAFSSYPEPEGLAPQAATVRLFLDCLAPLKAAGVQAMLYRGLLDSPSMDLANYYGLAERHFGLAWPDGLKPAGSAWLEGVQRERAAAVAPGANPAC